MFIYFYICIFIFYLYPSSRAPNIGGSERGSGEGDGRR